MKLEEQNAVIIDNGSFSIKSGFSNDKQCPTALVPNLIGKIKPNYKVMCLISPNDYYVGDAAILKRGVLQISEPVQDGLVSNWDSMQKIWSHVYFNELRVDPIEQPLVMIQSQHYSQKDKQKMSQILFEKLQIPAMYLTNQYLSSLWHKYFSKEQSSAKSLTGLIVNSSHTSTQIVPIVDSKIVEHAMIRIGLGGKHVENQFSAIHKSYKFENLWEKQQVKNIKESMCYVAQDIQQEALKKNKKQYLLGKDGPMLTLGNQLFQSCQILFNANKIHFKDEKVNIDLGIPEAITCSILNTDLIHHAELFQNIILSGGNTMFAGMEKRLKKQVCRIMNEQNKNPININIFAPEKRKYSAFLGGAQRVEFIQQNKLWISKQDYAESGSKIFLNNY